MNYSIKSILYASDLSPKSPTVFRHAVGLAQKFGAKLHAVTVTRPGIGPAHLDLGPDDAIEHLEEGADIIPGEALLRRRIATFNQAHPEYQVHDVLASVLALEGDPAKLILDRAKEVDADIIVMGSRGHSVIDELLLGSVAHKVTVKTSIPVVLVPFDR